MVCLLLTIGAGCDFCVPERLNGLSARIRAARYRSSDAAPGVCKRQHFSLSCAGVGRLAFGIFRRSLAIFRCSATACANRNPTRRDISRPSTSSLTKCGRRLTAIQGSSELMGRYNLNDDKAQADGGHDQRRVEAAGANDPDLSRYRASHRRPDGNPLRGVRCGRCHRAMPGPGAPLAERKQIEFRVGGIGAVDVRPAIAS